MTSTNLILHNSACPKNFWLDECSSEEKCGLLHFRRNGSTLRIINSNINLNRVERRFKAYTSKNFELADMEIPAHTELYLVDSQIDPCDFGSPIKFNNSKIYVARSIGIHSGTLMPEKYQEAFLEGLTSLSQDNGLAYVGPFGGHPSINQENQFDPIPSIKAFVNTDMPICLTSSDPSLDRDLGKRHFTAGGPKIIWANANRQNYDRSYLILDRYIKTSDRHYASITPTANQRIIDIIRDSYLDVHFNTGSRILYQSETPTRKTSLNDIHPLAVVNNIITTYEQLSLDNRFRIFCRSLADFNSLVTRHALTLLPHKLFTSKISTFNSFKARSQFHLGDPFAKCGGLAIFSQKTPIEPRFEGSMTDPNFKISTPRPALMALKTNTPNTTNTMKRPLPISHNKQPPSKRTPTDKAALKTPISPEYSSPHPQIALNRTNHSIDSGSFTWESAAQLDDFITTTLAKRLASKITKSAPSSAISTRLFDLDRTIIEDSITPKRNVNLEPIIKTSKSNIKIYKGSDHTPEELANIKTNFFSSKPTSTQEANHSNSPIAVLNHDETTIPSEINLNSDKEPSNEEQVETTKSISTATSTQ